MAESSMEGAANAAVGEVSLLDRIIQSGRLARNASQESYAKDLIGEFVNSVVDAGPSVTDNVLEAIEARIEEIDALISAQLNEVLHAPEFQKLEASWRGLHNFLAGTETSERLKLRVLNVTQAELERDLEKAVEFDQSALFKMIYEQEYGTFGGHPYGLLIGDYEFGRQAQDVAMLEKISNIAAAAHAPFLAAASPALFDLDSFTELGAPHDLARQFESRELDKWRTFRKSEDSRYVALVLPHVMQRAPYGLPDTPVRGMKFVEDVDGTDHAKYLWGNAAYALGQRITNAFAKYSWCAAIRGVEGGGDVRGLPVHRFYTPDGDIAMKCPTETNISDRREKELTDLGFISLVHCKNTDYAAFFGGQTANQAKLYETNEGNANARISTMLPYVLAASRFAHYIKIMMRDKVGSFMTRHQVSEYLNRWVARYVLLTDGATPTEKSRFPLRDARVDVTDVPGRTGAYRATVFLKPHFQLEELSVSIRLVADLIPLHGHPHRRHRDA